MKKILSIFTVILMLASFSVSAAVDSTASYRYDSVKGGFYVYGTINDTKVGDDITIEAYLNNSLFDTTMTETVLKDGKAYFESDFIAIDASKSSGDIKFKVFSANNVLSCETTTFAYYGITDNFNALKAVVAEMAEGDFAGIKAVLSAKENDASPYNYELLGVDYSTIENLSQNAGAMVGEYSKTVTFTLPANATTAAEKNQAFTELCKFREIYSNMSLIGNFVDLSSKSEVVSWYDTYEETLDLEAYNDTWYSYFASNYDKDEFYTVLNMGNRNLHDITSIKDRLLEVSGLTAVMRGTAASVNTTLNDYANCWSTVYTTLTPTQHSSVCVSLKGNAYGTFAALSSAYDEFARAILEGNNNPGPGSSPSPTPGSSPSKPNITFTPSGTGSSTGVGNSTGTKIFNDMADVAWAEKAVYSLYNKGIVSGKTATQFVPNDNVTRAEFIKMLVLASGANLDYNVKVMNDVNEGDWFFKYVGKAYAMGLIKGDELGNFNPNAQITREDMATMIYRLIGYGNKKGDVNIFVDAVSISDYAKDAVAYLNAEKIVSGMGDGVFAPKSMATRAQAAQIIYNIVK